MDYLGQDGVFDEDFWARINQVVFDSASRVMVGRRLISIKGPMGACAQMVKIDRMGKTEEFEDGYVKTTGRQLVEIPQLYSDFWLYWRDIESTKCTGLAPDLSAAAYNAQKLAQTEDRMIFYGISGLGLEGLLTVRGSQSVKRGDWSQGEGAFTDIATAIGKLEQNGFIGGMGLVVSPDLYLQLQRIQPGTGVLEIDRIESLLGKKVYKSTVLKAGTAVLFCTESFALDLFLGQDVQTAYLEAVDMNHHFRIMETALLRIKIPEAIVVFK